MPSPRTCIPNIPAGFSLIEVLVVLGLVAVIAGSTAIMSLNSLRSFSFQSERDSVIALLQQARSQAMSNVCLGSGCVGGKAHGVAFSANGYTVFQGPTFSARETAVDRTASMNYPVVVSGLSNVVFAQLSGNANPTGEVTLSDLYGHSSTIAVNAQGAISWTH